MDSNLEVKTKQFKEIEDKLKKLNITPDLYPEYSDPNTFVYQFEECTILKSVPIYTSDSCIQERNI